MNLIELRREYGISNSHILARIWFNYLEHHIITKYLISLIIDHIVTYIVITYFIIIVRRNIHICVVIICNKAWHLTAIIKKEKGHKRIQTITRLWCNIRKSYVQRINLAYLVSIRSYWRSKYLFVEAWIGIRRINTKVSWVILCSIRYIQEYLIITYIVDSVWVDHKARVSCEMSYYMWQIGWIQCFCRINIVIQTTFNWCCKLIITYDFILRTYHIIHCLNIRGWNFLVCTDVFSLNIYVKCFIVIECIILIRIP